MSNSRDTASTPLPQRYLRQTPSAFQPCNPSSSKMKNPSSEDKVLAESVDSVDDEPLFPKPDRDNSDCETSLCTRWSCRELIHNVSGVLSKIDQLKGSKLSYAKQVILNTELIFGTTPQQQALPVEDGFSVSHFLLMNMKYFRVFCGWLSVSYLAVMTQNR
ncbi:hypothetical protein P3L10_019913 [Capsicum annuum]